MAVSCLTSARAPSACTLDDISLHCEVVSNEICVVVAVYIVWEASDAPAATNTETGGSVTSTSQTAVSSLGNTNCIATAKDVIRAAGFADGGVGFSRSANQSYTGDVDYIALIATNNFFVQIAGANNGVAKTLSGRVWGYRARADASTYAALVQSEVLSA